MNVLVLGATGFIGGAVAKRLIARGDDVRVMVRTEEAKRAWAELGAAASIGSLGEPKLIAAAAAGADAVIHAAGISSSLAAPRALKWTHVAGTENVAKACAHERVKRLVFVGCADATLTNADRVHWDEKRLVMGLPLGMRARTLALAEELALTAGGPGLEATALRPGWVWGAGDTSRLPHLCKEALEHGGIRLFGAGDNYLAAIHIDNLVDAIVSALTAAEAPSRAFYLADPEYLNARELFTMLSEAIGAPPPRAGAPAFVAMSLARVGASDVTPEDIALRSKSSLFDVNNATGKLAFDPKVTTAAGMKALAAWAKEQGGVAGIAKLAKAPPDARSVDAQVAAAGGD
jgi:nucleoside-diphosphate-sugar epimerase